MIEVLIGGTLFLLLMAGLFVPLEGWFPARLSPPAPRAMWTAFGLFAANLLLMQLLGSPVLDAVEARFAPDDAPSGWRIALVFVLADVAGYWMHRAMHRVPFLWKLHAVHHAAVDVRWYDAWRQHPIDFVLHGIAVGLPGALLGAALSDVLTVVLLRKAFTTFLHANVSWRFGWLESVIATPAFHAVHHSADPRHFNRNFAGTFPLTDLVFGTSAVVASGAWDSSTASSENPPPAPGWSQTPR